MRKPIPLFVTLILGVAILGGCAKEDPAPPAPDTFQPNFSSVESEKMGTHMMWGRYLITDNDLYASFSDKLNVQYQAVALENGVISATDEKKQVFDIAALAGSTFLNKGPDDAVYLLTPDSEIARLPKGNSEYSVIAGPGITTLQVVNDKLYYSSGENSHYFSSDMNGQNEVSVLAKEIYYPYVIGNYIIYQDELDGQSLHLYNRKDESDIKLLDGHAHSPNVVGNWIFCIQKNPETTYGQLVGIEFAASGEFEVHVINNDDENWYANMTGLRYITRESDNPVAEGFVYGGKLMFNGAPVGDAGTANEEILTNLEGPMGVSVASLIYNPDWRIGGDRNNLYTSPYGYVYTEPLDGSFHWGVNQRPIILRDGLYEDEWSEKIISELQK